MIPLYGFMQGDTVGVLVLADGRDTMAAIMLRLVQSAAVRVPETGHMWVEVRGQRQPPDLSVQSAGLEALDRFDVRLGVG